jgi:cleavage stimulation factor subunit 3
MDALRKVYHRAVQIPLDNVERLWQELEAFETNLNRITAKKFMADLSPAHMQARTVLRQLVNHVGAIYPPNSTEIFLPSLPKFDASERALVGKWKAYLKWEEGNPLEIEEKDRSILITRIQGVYRKAVIRLRYYSEIWYGVFLLFYTDLLTLLLSQVHGVHVDKQHWKVR